MPNVILTVVGRFMRVCCSGSRGRMFAVKGGISGGSAI